MLPYYGDSYMDGSVQLSSCGSASHTCKLKLGGHAPAHRHGRDRNWARIMHNDHFAHAHVAHYYGRRACRSGEHDFVVKRALSASLHQCNPWLYKANRLCSEMMPKRSAHLTSCMLHGPLMLQQMLASLLRFSQGYSYAPS